MVPYLRILGVELFWLDAPPYSLRLSSTVISKTSTDQTTVATAVIVNKSRKTYRNPPAMVTTVSVFHPGEG